MKSLKKSILKASSLVLILTTLLVNVGCAKLTDTPSASDSESIYYSDNSLLGTEGTNKATASNETNKSTSKETSKSTNKATDAAKREFKLNTTNTWKYSTNTYTGTVVRTLTIDTGWGGEAVSIGQATDLHINYCNSNDLKDPVLYSTYQNRTWLKNGASLPNVERCLETIKNNDLVVLTGDVYDYYSEGVAQKANEYIFSKYDNVVACLGNHEPVCQMQGTVAETKSLDERRDLVQASWCNDIDYASYVLKNKVMVVLLNNSTTEFLEVQYTKFKADLEKARNNGYVVLVFYHISIDTGNPACKQVESIYNLGNQYAWLYERTDIPNPSSTGATKKVYDLICNNGDVIKGCFTGHDHSDFYTEILAKTPSGQSTIIPQYLLAAGALEKGHVLKIIVK